MQRPRQGFTLIELSIVLVIIGLIVGGVLTGQSLIAAAGVRAQITQIEKFNTAANTFYGKYGYLPGDIPAGPAAQFGFASRGTNPGQGDGNGILNSWNNNGLNNGAITGEIAMFWVDLSAANLIGTGLSVANPTDVQPSSTKPSLYLPVAAIGNGNYVSVWSSGINMGTRALPVADFFAVESVSSLDGASGSPLSGNDMTVSQAYSIDKKVDD